MESIDQTRMVERTYLVFDAFDECLVHDFAALHRIAALLSLPMLAPALLVSLGLTRIATPARVRGYGYRQGVCHNCGEGGGSKRERSEREMGGRH